MLARVIVATLLNKYDMFMIIEGGTGIGKSTLAFHIAQKVAREFRKLYRLDEETIEYYYERVGRKMNLTPEEFVAKILLLKQNKEYAFNLRTTLIYSQDEMQRALASWHNIAIPDEMINITFNRDFYSEKQKDIIKMINMFRDHENLSICCVPIFANIDVQIKNLCKIKITVKKRGKGIVHTPNNVVYSKDKWDEATNTKIEKDWIIRKIRHPNYSKLTTFRGVIRFPPMTKRQEELYQQIKNEKRAVILKDEMHIKVDWKEDDPFQKILKKLIEGGVRNGDVIDGYAEGMGLTSNQLRSQLRSELRKQGKPTSVSHFYWDKKSKGKEEVQEFEGV